MADPKKTLEQLIADHGGVLVRSKKHLIYRFPDGTLFTVACTPRCPHAYDNAVAELKRVLNLNNSDRGQPGERRERKRKQRPVSHRWNSNVTLPLQPTWQDKLAEIRREICSTTSS